MFLCQTHSYYLATDPRFLGAGLCHSWLFLGLCLVLWVALCGNMCYSTHAKPVHSGSSLTASNKNSRNSSCVRNSIISSMFWYVGGFSSTGTTMCCTVAHPVIKITRKPITHTSTSVRNILLGVNIDIYQIVCETSVG